MLCDGNITEFKMFLYVVEMEDIHCSTYMVGRRNPDNLKMGSTEGVLTQPRLSSDLTHTYHTRDGGVKVREG